MHRDAVVRLKDMEQVVSWRVLVAKAMSGWVRRHEVKSVWSRGGEIVGGFSYMYIDCGCENGARWRLVEDR